MNRERTRNPCNLCHSKASTFHKGSFQSDHKVTLTLHNIFDNNHDRLAATFAKLSAEQKPFASKTTCKRQKSKLFYENKGTYTFLSRNLLAASEIR